MDPMADATTTVVKFQVNESKAYKNTKELETYKSKSTQLNNKA